MHPTGFLSKFMRKGLSVKGIKHMVSVWWAKWYICHVPTLYHQAAEWMLLPLHMLLVQLLPARTAEGAERGGSYLIFVCH